MDNKWLRAVAAACVVAGVVASASASQPPAAAAIRVFVLAGQSNMGGRGLPVSDGTAGVPNLLMWRQGGWQPAADPLVYAGGVGPGMTFGEGVLAREPDAQVGLVMCAKSSSGIDRWQPGQALYDNCIAAARATGGTVDGILFLQGEEETHVPDGAGTWARGFAATEAAFERDLGPVPFVLGQIGVLDPEKAPYQQAIRDAQAAAVAGHPEIALVPTADLANDGYHFTVDAQKILGSRFAEIWYGLWQTRPNVLGMRPVRGIAGTRVRIIGGGFTHATAVAFGATPATFTIDSDGQITATVPAAAQTDAIVVSTPLGQSATGLFRVRPAIRSFAPGQGRPGARVTVTGAGFSGATRVRVGGASTAFRVVSPTRVTFRIPPSAGTGRIAVTTEGGTGSSTRRLVVTSP
ncbi:MAG TPA: sialate O-acetylesterase [Gaiellaceae bacterium]|nr:sialate O-acetylesterase [Gaiellaceae bacterium]